jgi:hypothetical protein
MVPQKIIYKEYGDFCRAGNYHACSDRTFGERLQKIGFILGRKAHGRIVYALRCADDVDNADLF